MAQDKQEQGKQKKEFANLVKDEQGVPRVKGSPGTLTEQKRAGIMDRLKKLWEGLR
jgi:hypothetical protein